MEAEQRAGYVVEDSAGFTLADFEDATQDDDGEKCWDAFGGYACSRADGHTGPHIAATEADAIAAIWEQQP